MKLSGSMRAGRRPVFLVLAVLALVAVAGSAREKSRPAPPAGPGKAVEDPVIPLTPDSAAVDSAKRDTFVPLSQRKAPKGLFISALASSGRELWAVGDSGFIAHGPSDTLLRRVENPGRAALHCAIWWDDALVCAGDSGRVLRVAGKRLERCRLAGARTVRDIARRGGWGLLCGDEGLLARSQDGGASWDTLRAPLPMRFHAVLCQDSLWWAGGAGGRLFRSRDQGRSWTAVERFTSPVVDLAETPAGGVMVLERSGRLRELGGAGLDPGQAPLEEAHSLVRTPDGWAVGGVAGRLALWDPLAGWQGQRLPLPTLLSGLLPWRGGLLVSGAWNTLAVWTPEEGLRLRRHDLSTQPEPDPQTVDNLLAQADSSAGDSLAEASLVVDDGPRQYQNVLATDARCTTPPTRMRQLERTLNATRWLGVPGRVMLALDISARGGLDSAFVLDEFPRGLGLADQALAMARELNFTPGFTQQGMVRSRMLFPVVFQGDSADHLAWARREAEGLPGLDSLLALGPRPQSALPPKKLVKAMSFPGKAKRFLWEGEALVRYDIGPDGRLSDSLVLWESEARWSFGQHALAVLPKLAITLPDSLLPAPGDHLRVTGHMRFDRRRYGKAAKEMAKGFQFLETRGAVAVVDSARYEPGLSQLEWLLNDFAGQERPLEWPSLALRVVLRHDGRLQDLVAEVPGEQTDKVDPAVLQSLALLFTWGRPRASLSGSLDTLAFDWTPRSYAADSTNCPPSLARLLHGVVY